ncbi:hypothetical protein DY000_02007793 [Brassica cretica]|uniref:Uncharacterized protein n=1 Tax=Brassica cretica TaxID=69181 RepID=A0ABQ7BXW1_BRACR|nr:hypothetical protein DY000_02007793 [Brassica cretica]
MAEMRTKIESMQHILEKEATTSPSIDANNATSIDVRPQTSHIPAEPESLAEKKDEWEIAYINTKINDVYNPLNNNVDWLSTRIDLLQQDLDTVRKEDQQPATSIDICTITSIDSKFAAMEDRLQTYEDMHDRFTSPIMRYLDTLSTQMMNVQRDIGTLKDQHDFQEESSTSIDRFRRASLDVKKPTEHLPYTAAEVDQITSKLYTAIDTMEDRFEKRCDDIYFPFDVRLSGLDSHAEWLQEGNPDVHYDPVRVVRQQVNLVELGNDLGYIAACHCGAEYEIKYSESIDTHTASSIDPNESPTTDERYPTSLDGKQPVYHFTLPDQCYLDFAFQQPNKRGRDDYSIGSWAESGFHESFAVDAVIPSSNEDPTEEYDEDYWKERAIEIAMQDDIYSSHSINNTSPPSIDRVHSASFDTHPHPAKRSYASIDTIPGTSIDIKAAAFEKEK